ncbi:MAG: hypothetical protein R2874_10410 [Desulfobacterales bacterium]
MVFLAGCGELVQFADERQDLVVAVINLLAQGQNIAKLVQNGQVAGSV